MTQKFSKIYGADFDPDAEVEGVTERGRRRFRRAYDWAMRNDHDLVSAVLAYLFALRGSETNLIRTLENHVEMKDALNALRARRTGLARSAKDPRSQEMRKVRQRWLGWQAGKESFRSDAEFARKMMLEFSHISSEGSIKNAITRWRKASSSS